MRKFPLILTMLCATCASATLNNGNAICDGTRKARADHAAALAAEAGGGSVVTGATLIQLIDEGCKA